jgi:hypothetical protein
VTDNDGRTGRPARPSSRLGKVWRLFRCCVDTGRGSRLAPPSLIRRLEGLAASPPLADVILGVISQSTSAASTTRCDQQVVRDVHRVGADAAVPPRASGWAARDRACSVTLAVRRRARYRASSSSAAAARSAAPERSAGPIGPTATRPAPLDVGRGRRRRDRGRCIAATRRGPRDRGDEGARGERASQRRHAAVGPQGGRTIIWGRRLY